MFDNTLFFKEMPWKSLKIGLDFRLQSYEKKITFLLCSRKYPFFFINNNVLKNIFHHNTIKFSHISLQKRKLRLLL